MASRSSRNDRKTIHDFILSESEDGTQSNIVRVEVFFNNGGMNYFTYKEESKGLYVSVTPLEITKRGGSICTSYTGFSGIKSLVKELNRFSQKQVAECTPDVETVQRLLDHVCQKNRIAPLDASVIYAQQLAA
ncbi:hypothetical protein KW459_15815 [Vibrio fluvialis]|nr:hypothetical protein [Vibrio fluvialis]